MESIRELKEICRKKHTKGVSKQHWWAALFTRRVSIYITWLIVKHTNISANQVTIWQMISSLIGIGLLCFANPWIAFAGVLFLHLGYVFDNVDGEVARYRKMQSINGMFLDFINHAIIIPLIFGCLAFHYYFSTGLVFYFSLGVAIIAFRIQSIALARYLAINFLVIKRHSPSYDVTNYRLSTNNNERMGTTNRAFQRGIMKLIRKARKLLAELFGYPNDVLIISLVVLIELVTSNTIWGRVLVIIFALYFAVNFILDIYVHLKNNVPERDFFSYIQACLEISKKIQQPENKEQPNK